MPKWAALLQPAGNSGLTGSAVAEVVGSHGSQVAIQVGGARPGMALAWRLRSGNCTAPGAVVGTEADYPALRVSAKGRATAKASVGLPLSDADAYNVTVLSADGNAAMACGDLKLTGMPGPMTRDSVP